MTGRISTRIDVDKQDPPDLVPAWDRLMDGDETALDDLTDEERQRLERFKSGGWDAVYDKT